jgi:hypothetical protein
MAGRKIWLTDLVLGFYLVMHHIVSNADQEVNDQQKACAES